MSSERPHPAEQYEASIATASKRASYTVIALVLTIAQRVISVGVTIWQTGLINQLHSADRPSQEMLELSDTLMQWCGISQLLLVIVTAVYFLRWLHITVRLTRALGDFTLMWQPKDAVLGFIIPFVSFLRPYQVIRDLYTHLEPEAVNPPPLKVVADETTGYRDVKVTAPPPPIKLTHASIGAWWAAWWIGNIITNIGSRMSGTDLDGILTRNYFFGVSDAVDIVSAGLAFMVVSAVRGRLVERFRRVRHTPVEQLEAAQIIIQ